LLCLSSAENELAVGVLDNNIAAVDLAVKTRETGVCLAPSTTTSAPDKDVYDVEIFIRRDFPVIE
jgi:hypothetical protein